MHYFTYQDFVLAVVIGTFILAIPRSKDDGKH